ncbi:MAG: hypothetical protein EBX49_09500 [Synechococcaceae bacterium WB8_1B_136]|nr:hypothetical protein [Synechococcaceae bacterium WB8_1B_136]
MANSADHDLGQRLGQLIQQSGDSAFEAGVVSRRLQAQLQDLLGADTALLHPLRDLLQRPAFRQLFSLSSQGHALNARDALLRDLAELYSPAVVGRLDAVLQGCLNLPATAASWPTASAFAAPAPMAAPPPTLVTIPSSQQGPSAIVIALLALLCGALVMALAGVLITNRSGSGTAPAPAAPTEAPQAATTAGQWQACVDYAANDGPPPQAGETWWPVVGSAEALQDARLHCRSDAFTNASGNTQVASFRDRATAAAFAQQLTSDQSHPHNFWVGDATVR